MAEGSGEIIVKGGSASIEFDPDLFEQDPSDPKNHKQKKELRITQVVIEGDPHIKGHASAEHPEAFKGKVRVKFKYEK